MSEPNQKSECVSIAYNAYEIGLRSVGHRADTVVILSFMIDVI